MKRCLPLVPLLVLAVHLHAQVIGGHEGARHAASEGNLQVGIAGSYIRPDYGQSAGGMVTPYVSLDFRRSFLGGEIDYNYVTNVHASARPDSLMFGVRASGYLGPFRLYVKPGIGWGHFSGFTTVRSRGNEDYLVYELSGGTDLEVTRHLNARIYGTYQMWPAFDGNTAPQFDHGGALNPIFGGVGLAYHF